MDYKLYFVYSIKNIINCKRLIGITTKSNPGKRFSSHRAKLRNNYHDNPHLQSSWNKYGEESFDFIIIDVCNSKEELSNREKYWINKFKTLDRNFGYNFQSGGLSNYNLDHLKHKIHQYDLEGNYIQSFESVADAALFVKGNPSNISSCSVNKRPTAYGYQWSYKKKNNINKVSYKHGKHKKIPVAKLDKNGNILEKFDSCVSASKNIGLTKSAISNVINGRVKTAGGYKWKKIK